MRAAFHLLTINSVRDVSFFACCLPWLPPLTSLFTRPILYQFLQPRHPQRFGGARAYSWNWFRRKPSRRFLTGSYLEAAAAPARYTHRPIDRHFIDAHLVGLIENVQYHFPKEITVREHVAVDALIAAFEVISLAATGVSGRLRHLIFFRARPRDVYAPRDAPSNSTCPPATPWSGSPSPLAPHAPSPRPVETVTHPMTPSQ